MSNIKIYIFKNETSASNYLARKLHSHVKSNSCANLGLASGKTFITLYKKLGSMAKKDKTSWKNIHTYNLDEFVGATNDMNHSCCKFMTKNLFCLVKMPKTNAFFPPSKVGVTTKMLLGYEQQVLKANCDIQLLGLGINGHIGFNEPYELNNGASSVNDLTPETIKTKADHFYNGDISKMTKKVVTVGINAILSMNNVVLCAFGDSKSDALGALIGIRPLSDRYPVQFLRSLPTLSIVTNKQCFNAIKTPLNVRNITIKIMDY